MVILGAHDISILEKTQQRFTVQSVHPHPNYNSRTKKNDIALLKVPTHPAPEPWTPGHALWQVPTSRCAVG